MLKKVNSNRTLQTKLLTFVPDHVIAANHCRQSLPPIIAANHCRQSLPR
jgi:hypothetical protein